MKFDAMKRIAFLLACVLGGYVGSNLGLLSAQIRPTGRQPVVFPAGDARHPGLHVEGDPSTGFFSDQNGVLHFVKRGAIVQTLSEPVDVSAAIAAALPSVTDTGSAMTFAPSQSATFNTDDFFVNADFSLELNGANSVLQGTNTIDLFVGATDIFLQNNSAQPRIEITGQLGSTIKEVIDYQSAPGAVNGNDSLAVLSMIAFTDTNSTGTNNQFAMVRVGNITSPDTNVIHTMLNIGSGWDTVELVQVDTNGWSAADNPPTNAIARFYDESADRGAGTGAADCAEIFRLSSGTEVVGQIIVQDGGC